MKLAGMLVGAAALAAAAFAHAALLGALRRTPRRHPTAEPTGSVWWFGYALDGANMFGFLSFSGAFALAGLPGPLAFLAGANLALVGYGLEHLFAASLPRERAATAHKLTMVLLAAAAGALVGPLEGGLRALVRGMF